ncbi:hypothetical protein SM124_16885 [Bacillus sp. 31A1R]|uniref:Uncharacterized protein n=1 Tax=Robertmurraya mangrovi TaxID=3098077 RepID=A0ABU5J1U9_9BACI|nr:hypothetical protein [Bacillus sp. 31A1R]MDZ5473390.1 hypothetical protein [Bacillus sp. 31A1R]
MKLDYQQALQYKGKVIQFRNEQGRMVTGKVVNVDEEGIEIKELNTPVDYNGHGYWFFGPRRGFYGRPGYRPGFRRYPYAGVVGLTILPFLFI